MIRAKNIEHYLISMVNVNVYLHINYSMVNVLRNKTLIVMMIIAIFVKVKLNVKSAEMVMR